MIWTKLHRGQYRALDGRFTASRVYRGLSYHVVWVLTDNTSKRQATKNRLRDVKKLAGIWLAEELKQMKIEEVTFHVHDNNELPDGQACLAQETLTRGKVLTLHVHDGPCTLCAEGHCHYGSIALTLTEKGDVYISFERVIRPSKITLDNYNPIGKVDTEHKRS